MHYFLDWNFQPTLAIWLICLSYWEACSLLCIAASCSNHETKGKLFCFKYWEGKVEAMQHNKNYNSLDKCKYIWHVCERVNSSVEVFYDKPGPSIWNLCWYVHARPTFSRNMASVHHSLFKSKLHIWSYMRSAAILGCRMAFIRNLEVRKMSAAEEKCILTLKY